MLASDGNISLESQQSARYLWFDYLFAVVFGEKVTGASTILRHRPPVNRLSERSSDLSRYSAKVLHQSTSRRLPEDEEEVVGGHRLVRVRVRVRVRGLGLG